MGSWSSFKILKIPTLNLCFETHILVKKDLLYVINDSGQNPPNFGNFDISHFVKSEANEGQ